MPKVRGQGDSRIAGRYRVLRALGQGGMGTIWLAHDELLDRQVAVKEVLLPDSLNPAERAEALQRAVREAMTAAQVRHPGIITIHDVLTHDNRPWIVMELLRGRDLKEAVAQEGPWPPERTAAIGLRVLDALSAAHAHGIQHRDVKPANVFLADDGRVILTDFGIARLEDQATLTESGLLIGSPGFIAPERLRGERGGPESDLWSLAATLYATVEGSAPYVGTSPMAVLRDALTLPPRPPVRAGHLGPVLMQMLARDPRQRPVGQAVAQLLQRVADGQQALAPLPQQRKSPRLPILVGGGVVAVIAAAAVAAVMLTGQEKPPAVTSSPVAKPATTAPSVTPTLSPSQAPEETTRFSLPVDFCTLLTAKQVRALAPGTKGKRDGYGCEWATKGLGIGAEPIDTKTLENPWDGNVDDALERFSNSLNASGGDAKITWQWPAIGMTKMITQPRRPAEELTGLGDEAFANDYVNSDGKVERRDITFRLSNLVVRVQYVNVRKIGDDAAIRKGALDAARWVAQALNRQE